MRLDVDVQVDLPQDDWRPPPRATAPSDLLLLIHGRSGGVVPDELLQLAEELRQQRGCRVIVQPLTDPLAAEQALALEPAPLT